MVFYECLGRVRDVSWVSRRAYPSRSVPELVWVIGPLVCGPRQSFFVLFYFSPCPPPSRSGAGGELGNLTAPTAAQDSMTSWFQPFVFLPAQFRPTAPATSDMTIAFIDVLFPAPYG